MKLHFIAIGGAAMHNLAIALKNKGYTITGSDDNVFEPSRSRLKEHGLLPDEMGWNPAKITSDLDGIILGMHARKDNSELLRAKDIGLKIYSYPEYLYEQTKNKKRVVIAGSHGKTTITAMVIHTLKYCGRKFDFMVGSQIEGIDTMVSLHPESDIAIFEGDEYLSSPIDLRPKFIHYKPHIALTTGIAWDHINVFPSFEEYGHQFKTLTRIIEPGGHFLYFTGDPLLQTIAEEIKNDIEVHPYSEHAHIIKGEKTYLIHSGNKEIPINIFGKHNLQNISGAKQVCNLLGVNEKMFYEAISTFKGTSKRLQILKQTDDSYVFLDFAHSPSKVKATVQAAREQFPAKRLITVLELHTFSSLNKEFLPEYKGTMDDSDEAIVYYTREVMEKKDLTEFPEEYVEKCFNKLDIKVYTEANLLSEYISGIKFSNTVLLLMSSGNFGGIDIKKSISIA